MASDILYCRYYLLWISIAAIIDGGIKEMFLYLSAERIFREESSSIAFPFYKKNISIKRNEALKVQTKRLPIYILIVILSSSSNVRQPLETLASATVLSLAIN